MKDCEKRNEWLQIGSIVFIIIGAPLMYQFNQVIARLAKEEEAKISQHLDDIIAENMATKSPNS